MDKGWRKVSHALNRSYLWFKLVRYVREKPRRVPVLKQGVEKLLGSLLNCITICILFSLVFWGWHVLHLQEASPKLTKGLLDSQMQSLFQDNRPIFCLGTEDRGQRNVLTPGCTAALANEYRQAFLLSPHLSAGNGESARDSDKL